MRKYINYNLYILIFQQLKVFKMGENMYGDISNCLF